MYKNLWTPQIEEFIPGENKHQNVHDRSAVRFIKEHRTVGHVPARMARSAYVLLNGGTILAKVTGPRENRRRDGLEVPCMYFQH